MLTSASNAARRSRRLARVLAVLVAGCNGAVLDAPDGAPSTPTDSGAGPDAGASADRDAGASVDPDGGPTIEPDAGPMVPADCPWARVRVAAGATLNLRPGPSTDMEPVGSLPNGAYIEVLERVSGQAIEGNTEWLRVRYGSSEGFVSAVFVECTTEEPPDFDGYYLPLECGTSARITQGNNGSYSHSGRSRYGFDFGIPLNTPLVAMAAGVVRHVYDETGPGDPCYSGGGSSCYPYANLVVLLHPDGTTTLYKHLNSVSVSLGDHVPRGAEVGLSGSSGYSTGPHAHVMRQEDCGEANCQSIPMTFVDVPGDGVPDTGDTVTSGNCP